MGTVDGDIVEEYKEKKVASLPDDDALYFDDPVKLKGDETSQPKRINAVLSPDAAHRLENIQKKLNPSTQTEAISKSLHLMETLIAAHENGTKVFFKDAQEDRMIEFRMFT